MTPTATRRAGRTARRLTSAAATSPIAPGDSHYNIIQFWACPVPGQNCCLFTISTISDDDPLFVNPAASLNTPDVQAEGRDYRVLWDESPAIDSGDPGIEPDDDNSYFPRDQFDVDDDLVTDTTNPYEVNPALTSDRVLGDAVDRGTYEVPCLLTTECPADCTTAATFQPPGDGYVDADDLAYLLGAGAVLPTAVPTAAPTL